MEKTIKYLIILLIYLQSSCDTVSKIRTDTQDGREVVIKRVVPSCCGSCGIIVIAKAEQNTEVAFQIECDPKNLCCRACGYSTKKTVTDLKNNKIIKQYLPVFDTSKLFVEFREFSKMYLRELNGAFLNSDILPLSSEDSFLIRKAQSIESVECEQKGYLKYIKGFIEVESNDTREK